MAFWPGWLSLIEEGVPLEANYRAGLHEKAGSFFQLSPGQDLQQIRHNRSVAIYRVPGRVKAVLALL
jgi:hypothetical protein